jgi:methyl-accepting chemotaxis protein
MLNKFGIGKRIGLAFGLVGLVVIAIAGITLYSFNAFKQSMKDVRTQSDQIMLAKDTHRRALQVMTYIGAMAATGNKGYLESIAKEREAYKANLDTMMSITHTEESKKVLQAVVDVVGNARESNTQVLELAKSGKTAEAMKMFADVSLPNLALWNAAFDKLNERRQVRMEEALTNADAQIRHESWILLAVGIVALLAVAFLGYVITASITRPINGFMGVLGRVAQGNLTAEARVDSQDEIGQLGRSLNDALRNLRESLREVTSASMSVASGATELSTSAEQMSTTTQEIAQSGETLHLATDTVTSAIVQFMASVEQVAGNVKVSVEHMEEAVSATDAGSAGSKDAAKRMARIREATAKISSAVNVIREIAQQTNLLSLNAAIEAAKAGEQGKGFAVVAEEVRKLAERSRQATVEIEKLILETREAVEGGVSSVETTTGLMDRIHGSIASVSNRVREIGLATKEQSSTVAEIAKRMEESAQEVGQNATATQELSATVQEISRTASDLAQVSESLAAAVAKFQIG